MIGRPLIVVAFLLAGCAPSAAIKIGVINDSPVKVSIIALLALPTRYEGKRVEISGWLHPDWEGPMLFLIPDHCRRYSAADGIALRGNGDAYRALVAANRWCHHARVVGTFESPPSADTVESTVTEDGQKLETVRIGPDVGGYLNAIEYLEIE